MIAFDGPVQKPLPDAVARRGPHATRVSNPAACRILYQPEQVVFGGGRQKRHAGGVRPHSNESKMKINPHFCVASTRLARMMDQGNPRPELTGGRSSDPRSARLRAPFWGRKPVAELTVKPGRPCHSVRSGGVAQTRRHPGGVRTVGRQRHPELHVPGGAAEQRRVADSVLGLRPAHRLRTRLRGRRSGQSNEASPCRVLARRTSRCAFRRGELAGEVETRAGRSSSSAEWHILKRRGVSRKIRPQ